MMTSTSLTALYLSYGLKPCRVILERLPVLEAIQTPVPAKPPKTPQTRVKPSKFRNGKTRSSLSQKKPSKVASKATTRLWDPAGSPGSKEVTSEEPADKACTDKTGDEKTPRRSRKRRTLAPSSQVGPPLENLPCDCESEKASLSTEKEKEAWDPVVATHQSEIFATKAGRSRGCRVTRSHPEGRRDATPAVDVPSCSDTFPSNVFEESDKTDKTSEEASVINQPPEIAKFLKRRHSQPSHSLPQKLQAFTPALQACSQVEELRCNHVADSEKEKETEDAVTPTPKSKIHIKGAGRTTRSSSRMEYSLTPALQAGASVEVFFGKRVVHSEKKDAVIQASRTPKVRKTRRSTPKWRHGFIRQRRPRRKLPFTPPASTVRASHSELLVGPAVNSAFPTSEPPAEEVVGVAESPVEEILGIDPMAEETTEETAEVKQLPTETRLGDQCAERGDHQEGTLEPPTVQGLVGQQAAKQFSAEATESELGVQEPELPAELSDRSAEGGSQRAEEPGDQPVPTSEESQAKAKGPKRRRPARPKGLRVSRTRGKGQQRRYCSSAADAVGAQAAAGIVHLPVAEEAVPMAASVEETPFIGTYVEESVTTMSLDEAIVEQGDMLVSLGAEQWAVISGEVVKPRPTRELYLERQDIPPSKGKHKRGRRRKSKLTAPKRRGRPPKNQPAEPKKRGRPRKDTSAVPPVKCRGRPRKNASLVAPKRRGRPPKNAPQAQESKGRRGGWPTNTPASSAGKRRPGRPRKDRVGAWIDPWTSEQDRALVPWNPALGGDALAGDGDESGWETTSNISFCSSVWHFDRDFESSDDERPARKTTPQKRRGACKEASTQPQPPRKRGRPRKYPLEAACSAKETSARGRATRGMKTPCPWEESSSLTLSKFQGESPPALPYDSDDDAGDPESDWETCSNVSVATIDANFEDMLLPGVDLDWPGPSRQEEAGFFPAIQGGEPRQRCNGEQVESLVRFINEEALSEGWEMTGNASSGWNTELDAMLIPAGDSDHSGEYIVTEPEDEFITYEELQTGIHRHQPGDSPVFLGNSSPIEGSPESYLVAEPVGEEDADEVPQEAEVDRSCSDDRTEPATVLTGVGGSDHGPGIVVLPREDSNLTGGNAPSESSVVVLSDSAATESICESTSELDSGTEAPVTPGINAAGGSAPEVIEISDDEADGNDGLSAQPAGPQVRALVPSMEEVADVEVPVATLSLSDTETDTNTQIPPAASSDTSINVQSLADALSQAAVDIPSSTGVQPLANAPASGRPKDIEGGGRIDLEECRQFRSSYTSWCDQPGGAIPSWVGSGFPANPEYSPVVSDEDDEVDHQELEPESKNLEGGSAAIPVDAQSPLQSQLGDSEGDEADDMSDFDVCSHVSSMYCAWNSDLDARSVASCRGAEASGVSGAEMSEWESTSVMSDWTDFDAMLASDSESEDGKGGREAGTRQVSESKEGVRSTRKKQSRPRKTRPLYVERRRYSDDDDDDDDYFPAGNESISDPGTSEAGDLGTPKRRPVRQRKTPFLPFEIIEALTRDSGSDYDAEGQLSTEEEEATNPDETLQLTEAEARQRDVQRNLRIAPFKLNQPPKRRRGNKRRKDADPDYELPKPEYEPADESPDEANYTFRRDATRSPKDIKNGELDELTCLESGPENAPDGKPQVSTAFSAMECKEALHDELFCDECGVDHPGDCPVHGPLIYVEDTQVPKGTPLRANKTLPEGLDIRRSAMRGAQFGVFAMKPLAKRTCFGPYEGIRRRTNRGNGYTWKVYGRNGEAYMVDARPLEQSNWMRYVNCSPTEDQQNLVAFQRNGNVYFRTLRDINACEELVVWYGNSFAKDLGLIDYKGQSSEPKTPDPARRPIFKCDSCNDAFSLRRCLLSHKLRHHVQKPPGRFECRLCPYSCQTRWVIKRHVLIHTKHKPFKCQYCDKGFTQRGSLKIHQRTHTDERPFECTTCGQRFRDPSVLSRHQKLHTGNSKVHACPECGRSFSLKSDVKRHMRTHTGERPYKCTICAKPFRDLGHWRRHERLVHNQEYTLHCPFCGKGAAAMWNLRQHLRARHRPGKRDEPTDTEDENASGDDVKRESDNVETVAEGTEAAA